MDPTESPLKGKVQYGRDSHLLTSSDYLVLVLKIFPPTSYQWRYLRKEVNRTEPSSLIIPCWNSFQTLHLFHIVTKEIANSFRPVQPWGLAWCPSAFWPSGNWQNLPLLLAWPEPSSFLVSFARAQKWSGCPGFGNTYSGPRVFSKYCVERLVFCRTSRCTLEQESAAPIYAQAQVVDVISSSLKLVLKVDKRNLLLRWVMQGFIIFCQKNILEHSLSFSFFRAYKKRCLLTMRVSQIL